MKHHFLDRYAHLKSPIHSINTTVKLLITVIFVVSVVAIPRMSLEKFIFCVFFVAFLLFLSHVPVIYFLRNLLVLLPFVVLAGVSLLLTKEGEPLVRFYFVSIYEESLRRFLNVVSRSLISLSIVQIFITTTRFDALLDALRTFKLPDMILELFSFIYRYVFILSDELMRSKMAAVSRGSIDVRVWSHILRGAIVRSYERGRLIYLSMKARGFEGEFRTLKRSKIGLSDILKGVFAGVFVILLWKI